MLYALVFDMDGVLADTEGLIARATIDMFQEMYGVSLTAEDFRPFIGTGAVRYVEGPAQNAGIAVDTPAAIELRHRNFVALLENGNDIALPGALDLIEAVMAEPHWRLAVATSSPKKKAEATLAAARVPIDQFHAFVNGDMVTHKKPHPEIYQVTSDLLNIPPERCVVVEDAIHGVTAAKDAGMWCIAVTNSFSRRDLSKADVVVDSLEDVNLATLNKLVK